MMGRQKVDQSQLFYLFNLEGRVPTQHLLRRINPVVRRILAELREKLVHGDPNEDARAFSPRSLPAGRVFG